jgi:hypothetical protein
MEATYVCELHMCLVPMYVSSDLGHNYFFWGGEEIFFFKYKSYVTIDIPMYMDSCM